MALTNIQPRKLPSIKTKKDILDVKTEIAVAQYDFGIVPKRRIPKPDESKINEST